MVLTALALLALPAPAATFGDAACFLQVSELSLAHPPASILASTPETELFRDWAFVPTDLGGTPPNAGAIDVWHWDGSAWVYHQLLTADIPGNDDLFGQAMVADTSRLLVGAPGWGQDRGAVYFFELSGGGLWEQKNRIHSAQPLNGMKFGWTCDLDGSRALIGHAYSITSVRSVETFLHDGSSWSFEQTLDPEGLADPGGFGRSVGLTSTHAFVGAHLGGIDEVPFAGNVFVYALGPNGWSYETTLSPPGPTANLRFGYTLEVERQVGGDHVIVIGRQCVGPNSLDRGFVFERKSGFWSVALTANPQGSECFASSVALEGGLVAFGARASALSGSPAGAVHLFARAQGGWVSHGAFYGEDAFELYGAGCSLNEGRLLAWSLDEAFVHDLAESASVNYCPLTPNSAGPGAVLDWIGPLSIDTNQLALIVTGAPPQKVGVVLGSAKAGQIPFGAGYLCVGLPFGRATTLVYTDELGSLVAPLDFASPPLVSANVQPGTFHFQFLYRDPSFDEGLNLSDALSLELCP